jgi:DNA-binding response OmpR family regulator
VAPAILVVDDDPKWVRVVSLYLRGKNYQVDAALNGEEALGKVAANRPDVVIADIGMPGMDGYELCSRLRRDPETRTIPFIFLTARDHDTDKIKARKIGSDDYLTKPCPLERLTQSLETVMDRIELARRIPLDRIGRSGHLEDVDLLDMVQMLELEQTTGALVLSHGERTGTLYFKDGVIVEADIQSPKREEPLFILLGWKTGRFLFLPDAVPERMPITASMANLLFQDLRALEEHEHAALKSGPLEEPAPGTADDGLTGRVQTRLEEVARRLRTRHPPGSAEPVTRIRILVVGVSHSGRSAFIQHLLKDLSRSRWVAMGVEESWASYRMEVGRVRLSRDTVLHLIAFRSEKRFWQVWEQCLPEAQGVILLADPEAREGLSHALAFLKAKETLAPGLPLQALLPARTTSDDRVHTLPGLLEPDISFGSVDDPVLRLNLLDRLLQQSLAAG